MRHAALAAVLLAWAAPHAIAQHTVSGAAFDAAGAPLSGRVRLVASGRVTAASWTPVSLAVAADGTFRFAGVPPGEYLLQAFGERGPGRAATFGVEPVAVTNGNPRPVTIRASAGAVLEGLIVVDGQPQSMAATVLLVAVPFDVDRSPGVGHNTLAISRSGAFYMTGLYGRVRFLLSTTSEGWYVKVARIAGSDATHRGFDFGYAQATFGDALIQVSRATGAVSGRVAGDGGGGAAGGAVVVFSTDPERWFAASSFTKRVLVSADGSFRVGGLPPGDYYVVAVASDGVADAGDWQAPDALRALVPAAHRVTVADGATAVVDVRRLR